jgi:hypothetical protein
MLVTDLKHMEKIVSSRGDLEWEGWNVVKYSKSEKSIFSVDGAYRKGYWCKKKVFPITENGWNVPDSIGKNNGLLER